MKRSYLIALFFVTAFQAVGPGVEKTALTTGATAGPAEVKPDEQLDIFKNALLNDPNDQIRVKAASVMLFSQNPDARKFLLDILQPKQTKNSAARMAICMALVQTTSSKESLNNKDDFIQPLLALFDTDIDAEAQLAAEATSIFDYEKIGPSLGQIATDASKPVKTRLNAIRALKLRPDMMATVQIIRLVDDGDKQIAAASEEALRSLSMPVGKDRPTREQIINELIRKGKNEFLRDWLIRREGLIRDLRSEVDFWRTSYLTSLSRVYGALTDDAAKSAFLEEQLRSPKAEVRLWALDRAYEWRVAPGTSLPAKLGPVLVSLISDRDRTVRLKIAAMLPVMGEVNSAQPLLAQLEVEQDEEVATELFGALGDACYVAFLPNSTIKIPTETRAQTLEWAAKFLAEPAPTRVRKGAEVMRKLLGQDGLTAAESDRYLAMLAEKYKNGIENGSDGAVRGELLNAMASLCAPQSVHKTQAKKQYGVLFEAALSDKTDFVREVAVDGLIYIDKTAALKLLRKDYVSDPSLILRKKLIALADEVGGKEDLNWLSEKIGASAEGEPAWQAMLNILKDLKDTDPGVWKQWVDKLTAEGSKLTSDQQIAFLKTAETGGVVEYRPEIRKRLAELYYATGQFDSAMAYFDMQYDAAKTAEDRESVLPKLLDSCLRGSRRDRLAELVQSYLSKSDLDLNSAIRQSINDYLNQPPVGADPDAVLKVLEGIKVPQNRTKWHQWLNGWKTRLANSRELNKLQQPGS